MSFNGNEFIDLYIEVFGPLKKKRKEKKKKKKKKKRRKIFMAKQKVIFQS